MVDDRSVLIVEDDEPLRQIVAQHLRRCGFQVTEAPSTQDAAAALEDGLRPDLVLLDLNLPGGTGWDLLAAPSFAAAGSPAVVIVSATSIGPRRLAQSRVADYLPKPFSIEILVATLKRVVDGRP
jgi:DNA-binding response OmpR family regulator